MRRKVFISYDVLLHNGRTLEYDGVTCDLSLEGQVKGLAIIPKGCAIVFRLTLWVSHVAINLRY